ncbi:MAG: hypothetical protein EP341_09645 [Sphingomonadales bacterium]|nr:MAG: hypothetical protein EP341_09645 [Sphingomonadales bacterium]
MEWQPIETAPWQEVILVKNDIMKNPVKATRGYKSESGVHPDDTFCTTEYTPDRFFPTFAGNLVCPTHWMPLPEPPEAE